MEDMSTTTRSERLALLLYLLEDDGSSLADLEVEEQVMAEVQTVLENFKQYPPAQEDLDLVLVDFEDYFKLALENSPSTDSSQPTAPAEDPQGEPVILQIQEEHFDVELEPRKTFETPKLTGNVMQDLNRVHPYQVAQVISQESPVIAAVVLRSLASEHAAKTLEFMPEHVRPRLFLKLAQANTVREIVVQRILEATLRLALQIEERVDTQDAADKMASLMRSLPRKIRAPMLQELGQEDPELSDAVKRKLYRFEDLKRLAAKDLQKVLGQCRTDMLVLALQQVDKDLLNQVLANMSKRAKEALQEEMEYKANANPDEIQTGRNEVLKILVQLEESGTITLE